MDKAKSALIFHNFWVQDIIFKKNPEYTKNDDKPRLDVKFSVTQSEEVEKSRIIVSIGCELFEPEFTNKTIPFYLNVVVYGQFGLDAEASEVDDEATKDQILKANTVAILFPYVRSIISTITATANIPPIILPPINTYKLISGSLKNR